MMNPSASSPLAQQRMRKQRRRDTSPELALRKELYRRGLRYRIHKSVFDVRRRHDIVFPAAKVVVEVRGCFWHGCSLHGTLPKSNREWWSAKLDMNKTRDRDTRERLQLTGWCLIECWEHDLPTLVADRVEAVVCARDLTRSREHSGSRTA
jgi:DNA mismatch endonuclease (patch repair protein)